MAPSSRGHEMEGKSPRQERGADGHTTSTIQKFRLLSPSCSVRDPSIRNSHPHLGWVFQPYFTKPRDSQRLVSMAHPNPVQLTIKFNHHSPRQEPRGAMQNAFPGFICCHEPCLTPRVPSSSPALLPLLLSLLGVRVGAIGTEPLGSQVSVWPLCPTSASPHCVGFMVLGSCLSLNKVQLSVLVPVHPRMDWAGGQSP